MIDVKWMKKMTYLTYLTAPYSSSDNLKTFEQSKLWVACLFSKQLPVLRLCPKPVLRVPGMKLIQICVEAQP